MKTINEIKDEIRKIDEALEKAIENYNNGIITSDTLNAQKIKFENVKNALEWVIK